MKSPLRYSAGLLVVDATIRGPLGRRDIGLVLDTGASSTTIVTELASSIGYNAADAYAHVTVSSALGQENRFSVRVNELTACGVTTFNFALNVFPLRAGVDGLLGMNFLRHFNFEIRLAEMCILLELISPELEILG